MRRIENNKIKFYLLNFSHGVSHRTRATYLSFEQGETSNKFLAFFTYEAGKFSENLSTTEL